MVVTSFETLVPPFDSERRQSSVLVATFNLVATIIGGGVLSLPLAFSKCGVLLATILMVIAAVTTDRSLHLLALTARQTGATTYGEIGRLAFGKNMEWFISVLLFVLLLFILIAYMVLVRDIWTPIVQLIIIDHPDQDLVLLTIIILMTPFLIQKKLHVLRFNCYAGFASVSILCFALCHHALLSPYPNITNRQNFLFTDSIDDVLFAFPIITLSFLSHFNILEIQCNLTKPTTTRTAAVIGGAVSATFLIMSLFGLGGFIYAGDDTQGNILLNCDLNNITFLMGRIGFGVTIMLGMANIMLPCRNSILQIIDTAMTKLNNNNNNNNNNHSNNNYNPETLSLSLGTPLRRTSPLSDNPCAHFLATFLITAACYIGAVVAPGVAIVWSLCGSSMAFMIAFILPSACYLKLQTNNNNNNNQNGRMLNNHNSNNNNKPWIVFSWVLLVFSVISAVVCTIRVI